MINQDFIASHFGSKAESYSSYARVQQIIAKDLLQKISELTFHNCCDLGCGPGVNEQALAVFCNHVVAVDLSAQMCAQVELLNLSNVSVVQENIESFNFRNFDLIFSSLALQWCDLSKFFDNLSNSVDDESYLTLAFPIKGTLNELEHILQICGVENRVNNFYSKNEIDGVLDRFLVPYFDISTLQVNELQYLDKYNDKESYLNSIRKIGATSNDTNKPFTKTQYRLLNENLTDILNKQGYLTNTYNILQIVGKIKKL